MTELKTDAELAALLLADTEQRFAKYERLWGDAAGERLRAVVRAETLLCAARELYRRLLAVARKPPRNVTANAAASAAVPAGGDLC